MNRLFVRIWLVLWLSLVLVVFLSVSLFEFLRSEDGEKRAGPPQVYLQSLANDLTAAVRDGKTPQAWLEQVSSSENPVYLINGSGEDLLDRTLPQHLIDKGLGVDGRGIRARLTLPVEVSGFGQITLAATRRTGRSSFRWFSTEILVGLGFLISGLAAVGLARYITFPIEQLKIASDRVAIGDFQTNAAASVGRRKDELADLARRFDQMSSALAKMQASQQNLLRDISHELRSPLTRMRLTTDLLAKSQPGGRDALEDRLQKDLDHLNDLVDEVVTLARFDVEAGILEKTEHNLIEGLLPVFNDAQFEANTVNKTVEFRHPDTPLLANVDMVQIRRAIENVVRNAIRHSPEGTRVLALAFQESDSIVVTVEDEGTGVSDAELDKIFTPFYRGATARAHFAGAGVGLALVERIIKAHRGTVSARNAPTGGLLVRIELPGR